MPDDLDPSALDQPATPAAPIDDSTEIVARPDAGYRWKHLIMAVLMIAGGLWFAYDGWVKWPRENHQIEQIQKDKDLATGRGDTTKVEELANQLQKLSKHTEMDLAIQKALAFVLPAFGIFWGAWTLRDTRGLYQMTADTLNVPGHPPVTYNDVRRIDKRKWDKKGIAYLHYEAGGPPATIGVLKLDDFAYERKPTDDILDRIERNVLPSAAPQGFQVQ